MFSAPLSETWREELRDLAAKVSLAASGGKEKKAWTSCSEVGESVAGHRFAGRTRFCDASQKEHERRDSARETQYSARTGRIVPPSSQTSRSRCSQASLRHSRTRGRTPSQGLVYDQELLVLELLCQVLQTDSLSQVQQWLLFADAREKDLVMGLLQQALDPSVFHELRGLDQKESVAPRAHTLPAGPPGREDAPCGDDWNSGGPSGPFRGNRIS